MTGYAQRKVRNFAVTVIAMVLSVLLMVCDARSDDGNMCSTHPTGVTWVQNEFDELTIDAPTPTERLAVYEAVARCSFRTPAMFIDHTAVLALLRLEGRLSIPKDKRGILPAVWCIEASMQREGKKGGPILGDYREGRGHISHGPFQLSQSLRDWCGGNTGARQDLIWSARCWIAHVHRVLPKATTHCPERAWVYAEALVSNPNSYRGNCRASSKHYKLIGM